MLKRFFLAGFLLLFLLSSCEDAMIPQANAMIARIDSFRQVNDRLPESLREIGEHESEEGPLYYLKKSDSVHLLWYGTTLGESNVYTSDTKKWESARITQSTSFRTK